MDISLLALRDAIEFKEPENKTNVNFIAADAEVLFPIESKSYDVVFANRVLEHLENPLETVKEMVRVTKQNGRVVTAEPDWSSLSLRHPNKLISQQILEAAIERGFVKNPSIKTEVADCFLLLGLEEIKVTQKTDILNDRNVALKLLNIPLIAELAKEKGIDVEQVDNWQAQLEELDTFEAQITVFITSGKKVS